VAVHSINLFNMHIQNSF